MLSLSNRYLLVNSERPRKRSSQPWVAYSRYPVNGKPFCYLTKPTLLWNKGKQAMSIATRSSASFWECWSTIAAFCSWRPTGSKHSTMQWPAGFTFHWDSTTWSVLLGHQFGIIFWLKLKRKQDPILSLRKTLAVWMSWISMEERWDNYSYRRKLMRERSRTLHRLPMLWRTKQVPESQDNTLILQLTFAKNSIVTLKELDISKPWLNFSDTFTIKARLRVGIRDCCQRKRLATCS